MTLTAQDVLKARAGLANREDARQAQTTEIWRNLSKTEASTALSFPASHSGTF